MIISDRVKHFVEDNINTIENNDMFMLLTNAYEELDNSECVELIAVLRDINPNINEDRESVLRYLMHHAVEGYKDYPDEHDVMSIQRFQSHYLTSRLGLSWTAFIQFLFDNEGEWPDVSFDDRDGIPVIIRHTDED